VCVREREREKEREREREKFTVRERENHFYEERTISIVDLTSHSYSHVT